jgi:hypothetical protein
MKTGLQKTAKTMLRSLEQVRSNLRRQGQRVPSYGNYCIRFGTLWIFRNLNFTFLWNARICPNFFAFVFVVIC